MNQSSNFSYIAIFCQISQMQPMKTNEFLDNMRQFEPQVKALQFAIILEQFTSLFVLELKLETLQPSQT